MMVKLESIVACMMYVNKATGQWASPYGALPVDFEQWELKHVGFTSYWSNGTRGHGNVPFKTFADAMAWANSLPESAKAHTFGG